MARITLSGLISDIKGKLGSLTFSNARGGLCVKKRITFRKAIGSQQREGLAIINKVNTLWNALSVADKEEWQTVASGNYGRYLRSIWVYYTGKEWFMVANCNMYYAGMPFLLLPVLPTVISVPGEIYPMLAYKAGRILQFGVDVDPFDDDCALLVYISKPFNAGVLSPPNYWKFIGVLYNSSQRPLHFHLTAEPIADNWIVDKKLFLKVIPVNTVTGQVSVALYNNCTIHS